MAAYRPAEIESRWQARWEADGLYELDLDAVEPARKLYNLVEFPYPSAEGLQRDWIGRSRGVEVDFTLAGTGEPLTAFTTRVDTLFGVTFVTVSPDHPRRDSAS